MTTPLRDSQFCLMELTSSKYYIAPPTRYRMSLSSWIISANFIMYFYLRSVILFLLFHFHCFFLTFFYLVNFQPKGMMTDFSAPVVLHDNAPSTEDFCNRLHKQLMMQFKYAWVWGSSVRHQPQKVRILFIH